MECYVPSPYIILWVGACTFSFRMVFFYLANTGWILKLAYYAQIQSIDSINHFNQSISSTNEDDLLRDSCTKTVYKEKSERASKTF